MMNLTFGGQPVTLKDQQLAVGSTLPNARLYDNKLTAFEISETSGVRVFLTVPSLDTPICDREVRAFNLKATELPGVSIYAVSVDLPFAQARWCGGADVHAVQTLSDYNGAEFGRASGTYISELALLARAIFVVDANNIVTYVQYVPEVRSEPDFEAAYAALAALA